MKEKIFLRFFFLKIGLRFSLSSNINFIFLYNDKAQASSQTLLHSRKLQNLSPKDRN
jgi:hypothetical protein